MFAFKKRSGGSLLMPLPLGLLLLALGFVLLFTRRHALRGKVLVGLSLLVLLGASLPPVASWSAEDLETAAGPLDPASWGPGHAPGGRTRPFVVVLGCGTGGPRPSRVHEPARSGGGGPGRVKGPWALAQGLSRGTAG